MQIKVKLTRTENADYYGAQVGDTVEVPLETYVAGVVASEMGNPPIEAAKAQAIAARTFAYPFYSQLYPMDDGYDRDGGWEARGTYGRTGGRYSRTAYDRGNSYANRGMHYVRGHYSRAEAEDELMQKLREMSADMKLPEKYRKTAKDALAEMK